METVAVDQSETCGGECRRDQNAIELTIPGGSRNEASNFDNEAQVAVERANIAGRGVLLLSSYSWGELIETWHHSNPGNYEYYRWRTLPPSNRLGCGYQHHRPYGYFSALNGTLGEVKATNELFKYCPIACSTSAHVKTLECPCCVVSLIRCSCCNHDTSLTDIFSPKSVVGYRILCLTDPESRLYLSLVVK